MVSPRALTRLRTIGLRCSASEDGRYSREIKGVGPRSLPATASQVIFPAAMRLLAQVKITLRRHPPLRFGLRCRSIASRRSTAIEAAITRARRQTERRSWRPTGRTDLNHPLAAAWPHSARSLVQTRAWTSTSASPTKSSAISRKERAAGSSLGLHLRVRLRQADPCATMEHHIEASMFLSYGLKQWSAALRPRLG